jgi:DNA modification methylase
VLPRRAIIPTAKVSAMEQRTPYCSAIADLLLTPRFNNETDVREDFILPLLKALGYSNTDKNRIERNINLQILALIVGTKTKGFEGYQPDYVLSVRGVRKWVIDAKGPKESVLDKKHISQAYSYSIHKEINVPFFVLCNGEDFAVFRTADQTYAPVVVFKRYELDYRWKELYEMFSVQAFETRLTVITNSTYTPRKKTSLEDVKWNRPISQSFVPRKQKSPIHAGTHPYFTKRAWNIVREYIGHYSEPGETILDPFGGAGVTAIESVLMGRKAIHVDINPIANFMTEALAIPVRLDDMSHLFAEVIKAYRPAVHKIYNQENPKPRHWYPQNVRLPPDADVEYLDQYFTPYQLAAMALLRHEILKIEQPDLRKVFLLIFSSTLVKCNISFHNTGRDPNNGGGDAGFLKYYRYQIPSKRYPEQDPVEVFTKKYKAMLKAKAELLNYHSTPEKVRELLQIVKGSATDLSFLADGSVDYVFTDPPYGSNIGYLDCSVLWNAWLELSVTKAQYEEEIISGGSLRKSDERYVELLHGSIREIHRVLKNDRWFSIVFASDNPKYWHAVRDYSIQCGFEHVNTVCQPSDRKTVKKNQNPLTVFKGELILNFRKRRSGKNIVGVPSNVPPRQYVLNSAELTIVNGNGKAVLTISCMI